MRGENEADLFKAKVREFIMLDRNKLFRQLGFENVCLDRFECLE